MNPHKLSFPSGTFLFLLGSLAVAQVSRAASVTIEAESGTLGTNFSAGTDLDTQYISNTNNTMGSNPGIPGRVATYSVTFPQAGTYSLYARIRVNAAGASDDSLFYGNGFGVKTPILTSDWVQANNLWNVGYVTGQTNVVLGGGTATTNVWKWINLSAFAPGSAFTVTATNLTQTFQIGGREDGLDIDKLLFGTSTNTFTVADLDAGGVTTNRAPVAVSDSGSTPRITAVTVAVLANDSDPDGDALTLVTVSATNGTAVIVGTNVVYTPVNALGTNTIIYAVTDGQLTNTGLVFISVTNRAPTAANDAATSPVNVPVNVPVLVNDSDADGDVLTIISVSPTNGTATISGTNVVFTPTNGLTGTVGYRISDGFGGTNSALIAINKTNGAPVVVNDSRSTPRSTPVTVPVLANDSDPDGDPLTLVTVSATNGTAVIVGTNVVYTPVNALGTNTIIYTVTDGQLTNTGLVFIAVTNRPPVAGNDTATSPVNVPVNVPVLANDSDPDGDALTIVSVSPTNGTALISGTNVVFTPTNGLTGTVGYRISDGFGGTNSALVTINATNPPPTGTSQGDIVAGNLIQFNDNGSWSWYMDERAIVDKAGGKLVVGSDRSDGAVDAVVFDLQGGTSKEFNLMASGTLGADDHNAPAVMLRPDGKYLTQWTGHNQTYLSYFRVIDGNTLGPQTTFNWQAIGATSSEMASYSNPHYLAGENRTYTFVRSLDVKSMNILVSTNYGDTWTYYGKLNRSYPGSGYNPGYYRFSDNGVDRIDFICTESHPRDSQTSIYHGYISNGMSFKSDGTVVDSNLNDTNAPLSSDFQLVFANGTVLPAGQTNYRCWNSDVQLYPDGTVQAIIHARINQFAHTSYPDTEDPNHAFFFCRYDGTNWATTYLCQAGYKVYSAEADYVGLGTLDPDDPNTIFISTKYDPRAVKPGVFDTNQPYSSAREIWKGVTTTHGASFTWTPITQKSVRDNLRPVIPAWDGAHRALLWFRGTYNTAQSIDAAVVGILENRLEVVGQMHYVDATAGVSGNTTLSNGTLLTLSASANQWHSQTGVGNGGTVLSSADSTTENAPTIMTQTSAPGAGTYDVWVNFWGNPSQDWRINAGLAASSAQTYRSRMCGQVQPGTQDSNLVLTNSSPAANYLYQAYVGRVVLSNDLTIKVVIDDTSSVGNTGRTWYDGISYAKVSPSQIPGNSAPTDIALSNSTLAENQPAGTAVGTLTTSDPDAGNTFTYALVSGTGSANTGSFSLTNNTLYTAAAFNYEAENTFSIRVRSTDQGGLSVEKVLTVAVTNVNETPTDIALSNSTLIENEAAGTAVGTLNTSDPDAGNMFAYELVSGTGSTDNASFSLTNDTLYTAEAFNHEAQNSYSLRVRSTDQGGLSVEKVFTVTVNDVNEPPTLTPVVDEAINAWVTLLVTNVATDFDVPSQALTFSLLSGPTNSTLTTDASSAVFAWHPLVSQANTTNLIMVTVTDDGTPSLSATNSFTVIVNPLAQPEISSISVSGEQISLGVNGPVGPDYTVLTSTNLENNWQVLLTTNSPVTPLTLVVTNDNALLRFYRLQLGP